ncbi:hypothetical protein Tco_1027658 [Tanacetum coccineum]
MTLRIAHSGLVDAVTAALPSPPLPPLPSIIYHPQHCDRRMIFPEFDEATCRRSCLFAQGSRYEVEESSTTRPTGEAVPEIAPMTMGEVNTRVIELAELHKHDTQDLYALLEDAQGYICFREAGLSDKMRQAAHYEAFRPTGTLIQTQHQVHKTRSQMQQAEMAELRETDRKRKGQMVEILRVMRDMRREMGDMQAELLALREQQRRARQPAPDARILDHQDASRDADSHI